MKRPTIEQAQAWLTDRVMERPGIAGTVIGECEGEPCIHLTPFPAQPILLFGWFVQ